MTQYIAIILAAGKGTRMNSITAKPVYPVCGQPMIKWVYNSLKYANLEEIAVIFSDHTKGVQEVLKTRVNYIKQNEQLGTGHALMIAEDYLKSNANKNTLVIMGDIPTITAKNLKDMMAFHNQENNALTILTSVMEEPSGYGRIVRKENGLVKKVTQEVDTDFIEKKITEVDAGIYCFRNDLLIPYLHQLTSNNQQQEYYLTDLVEILSLRDLKVNTIQADKPENVMCVNNLNQHFVVEKYLAMRRIEEQFK